MQANHSLQFDFLAIGEALIDLISSEPAVDLADTHSLQRFAGGQTANLARNMALLGWRTTLAASLGEDGFGRFIAQQVQNAGIDGSNLQISQQAPTTLACVTKTPGGTPEFVIYRGADAWLQPTPTLIASAAQSRLVHTSAFALSRNPARTTILDTLSSAHQAGRLISLDPNYHPRIWPDTPDFLSILRDTFAIVDVTKPSLDDCHRIFGAGQSPQTYAQHFLNWGVKTVILTLGEQGVLVVTAQGMHFHIPTSPVKVVDVTGAGDAFWAGFLTALLDGANCLDAARFGQAVAEIKIGQLGPLTRLPDRQSLQQRAQNIQYITDL